jgi:hypothetical protein
MKGTIAKDYRSGDFQWQIAERYGISEYAVYKAIKKLLPGEEWHQIAEEHMQRGRSKAGSNTYRHGNGIFSMTEEEHLAAAKAGVRKIKREKLGIFKPGFKRGPNENNIRARGLEPWSDKEQKYFMRLCGYRKYQNTANNPGCPDYGKISAELRRKFGTDRPPDSLNSRMYRLRHRR